MTITRKTATIAIAAGMALVSTPAVANAQSSVLFGNLSSSSDTPAPAPDKPSYENPREELKKVLIEDQESDGAAVTDEANTIAQELSEALVAGVPVNEVHEMATENGGDIYVFPIPNVLLESRIDSFIRLNDNMFPYFAEISGIGVSGNEHTTYVVGFFKR